MANFKYFHVRHLIANTDFLARAPKAAQALIAIAGSADSVKPATDDQIASHLTSGGALHEKSVAEGEGKLFFVATTPSALIRAKNEADAFSRLNDGVYSVEPASQDTLVRLLTGGIKPVDFVEPDKTGKQSKTGAGADAGAAGGDAQNNAGQASTEGAAPAVA